MIATPNRQVGGRCTQYLLVVAAGDASSSSSSSQQIRNRSIEFKALFGVAAVTHSACDPYATGAYLQAATPAPAAPERWHLLVRLVVFVQIRLVVVLLGGRLYGDGRTVGRDDDHRLKFTAFGWYAVNQRNLTGRLTSPATNHRRRCAYADEVMGLRALLTRTCCAALDC
uniref:Uncharacterized protein n=1 Tax=Anopheles coluzzii TaxID=1518534 RepID=A0A8W7PQJ6_ANOCL